MAFWHLSKPPAICAHLGQISKRTTKGNINNLLPNIPAKKIRRVLTGTINLFSSYGYIWGAKVPISTEIYKSALAIYI